MYCERFVSETYAELNLKHGEVDVLDTLLLNADEPQSPKTVGAASLCSSGAMTNRLDRLEKAGLIKPSGYEFRHLSRNAARRESAPFAAGL